MTFYKTRLVVDVLSEAPIPDEMDPQDIMRECDTGDFVGHEKLRHVDELTGEQMAKALRAAGSDPGFFMLDDDGNTLRQEY